jgi:hypothetical protein
MATAYAVPELSDSGSVPGGVALAEVGSEGAVGSAVASFGGSFMDGRNVAEVVTEV